MEWPQVLSANYALLAPSANVTTQDLAQSAPFVAQAGEPSGDGVITLGHGGQTTRMGVLLQFYGLGDDQTPLQIAVIGWRRFHPTDPALGEWVPMPICEATATLDANLRGAAGRWASDSEFMAGSIAVTNGYGLALQSGLFKAPAALRVPTFGCRFMSVLIGVGAASYANGMWAACDLSDAPPVAVPVSQ